MVRRFMLFLIGAGLGCLFVYFTLIKDRDRNYSSYFPNGRVLKKIDESLDSTQTKFNCLLACNRLSKTEFYTLLENGEVDFDKSETQAEPKKYLVNSNLSGLNYLFHVTLKDSIASLDYLYTLDVERDCVCDE